MLSYYLKCRKSIYSKNPKVAKMKNGRILLLSKCAMCDSEKWRFIEELEAGGLLSSLEIKTSLSKVPLVGPLLF